LGHRQPHGGVLDADPTGLGEQFEERVPARVPVHYALLARTCEVSCTIMRETGSGKRAECAKPCTKRSPASRSAGVGRSRPPRTSRSASRAVATGSPSWVA